MYVINEYFIACVFYCYIIDKNNENGMLIKLMIVAIACKGEEKCQKTN